MQMKFVKCVEVNDTDGAYRTTDSLKAFALKNNRLNVYYYCFNNLVIMECSRGKFHHAIHISQHILEDIEKRNQDLVFNRFFRSASQYHGVGLGLPICRKIGSLINARIYLDKEYNNGSRFIIEIEN